MEPNQDERRAVAKVNAELAMGSLNSGDYAAALTHIQRAVLFSAPTPLESMTAYTGTGQPLVTLGTLVDCMLRDGSVHKAQKADGPIWGWAGGMRDVIAYRVVTPVPPTPLVPVPIGVYWDGVKGDFYDFYGQGKGDEFRNLWFMERSRFPTEPGLIV